MFYGDGKNYAPGFGPKKPMDHQLGKRPEFTYDAPRPEFVTDVGQVGRERQAVAEIAGGYGRAGSPANIAGAPAMAPKKRGDTFNDNGQTLYYDDKSSTYLGKSAYDRLYNPQPAKAARPTGLMTGGQAAPLAPSYTMPDRSALEGPGVDWASQRAKEQGLMDSRNNAWRADAARSASVNAAKRGLMQGGNSGATEEMQREVDREYRARSISGGAEMDARLFGQMMGDNLSRQSGIDNYRGQLHANARGLRFEPYEIEAARQGNEYGARTMDSRGGQQQEAYTGGLLNNQGAEIANGITREQGAVMKDTLERLRRKEEAGLALSELELKQKKWADDNAWWLGPLMFGGEVVKSAAGGAGKALAGGG